MKTWAFVIFLLSTMLYGGRTVHAQTNFQDLNFESATLSPAPVGGGIPVYVPITSALPGWSALVGGVTQTQVIQNNASEGEAEINILGPNYPSIDLPPSSPGYQGNGVIDGDYTIYLQSGASPSSEPPTHPRLTPGGGWVAPRCIGFTDGRFAAASACAIALPVTFTARLGWS